MPPAAIVSIVFYYDSFSKSEKKNKGKKGSKLGLYFTPPEKNHTPYSIWHLREIPTEEKI